MIAASTAAVLEHSATNKPAVGIDVDILCQHWVHSTEEKSTAGKDEIFRPVGSRQFPPSRFRMAYKFTRNGDCEWFYLSPDDNHHFRPGRWMTDAVDKTLLKITANGRTNSYKVVELSKNILHITPLESKPDKQESPDQCAR